MALKGHTKIQLFDAKTGELVQETNDDNMVTNAVSKLINPPLDFLVGDLSLKAVLSKTLPIQTTAMAGVMVFSNKIEENANHVLAGNSDISIGHAGSVYSGTNIKRGTYNTNESKALSNGYRHVWDFGTDRANGDISCVCLTSKTGGDIGIDGYSEGYCGIQYINGSPIFSIPNGYYVPVAVVDKGKVCAAYMNYTTLKLRYYQGFDSDKIPLAKSSSVESTVYKDVSITFDNFYNTSEAGLQMFYVDDEGILRIFNSNAINSGNNIYQFNVYYGSANVLTGTKIDDKKITVDFSTFPEGRYSVGTTGYYASGDFAISGIMKNYIVATAQLANTVDGKYVWEKLLLDYNGKFVKYFDKEIFGYFSSSDRTICYDIYNKRLRYSNDKWITEDGNIVNGAYIYQYSSGYNSERIIYFYKNIFPFYLIYHGSPSYGIVLYINYTYLATINNLATTVTKTSGQTMKITYDITET